MKKKKRKKCELGLKKKKARGLQQNTKTDKINK